MKTLMSLLICFLLYASSGFTQTQDERRELPKLDIPEITIVGKKAITLPFARKGEVLEIELFEAPPVDASILDARPDPVFPAGIFPRHAETLRPWRLFVEGEGGNYSSFGFNGVAGYSAIGWEAAARGGFAQTEGHTTNAKGSRLHLGANASAIIATDNDFLGRFRSVGSLNVMNEEYGVFGIRDSSVERRRRVLDLQGHLASAEQEQFSLSLGLGIQTISLKDEWNGGTAEASAVSPKLSTGVGTNIGAVRLQSGLSYESSSLTFTTPAESPGLLELSSAARWKLSGGWSITGGLKYGRATHSDGESSSLLAPIGTVRWEAASELTLSFWWEPEVQFASYTKRLEGNPYLARESPLRHERKLMFLGTTVAYAGGIFSGEARISFADSRDTPIPQAENGTIHIVHATTRQTKIELHGSARMTDALRLSLGTVVQPAYANGTSKQLPMVPIVRVQTRGEYSFNIPLTVWTTIDVVGRRYVDFAATRALPSYTRWSVGTSSTILPFAVLSLDLDNILDRSYEWWEGYDAPGFKALVRLQLAL